MSPDYIVPEFYNEKRFSNMLPEHLTYNTVSFVPCKHLSNILHDISYTRIIRSTKNIFLIATKCGSRVDKTTDNFPSQKRPHLRPTSYLDHLYNDNQQDPPACPGLLTEIAEELRM